MFRLNTIKSSIFVAIVVLVPILGLAVGPSGSGGGVWTEGDFKYFLKKLRPYLQSAEGKAIFPEIAEYDKVHPEESFDSILATLSPRLQERPVYDLDGNERDCFSGFDGVRYFKCNSKKLPQKSDDQNALASQSTYYGSLYRLVLHEAFVQAGLERPLSKEVPSEYALASRLTVHLEMFPEWVPGNSIKHVDLINSKTVSVEINVGHKASCDGLTDTAQLLSLLDSKVKAKLIENLRATIDQAEKELSVKIDGMNKLLNDINYKTYIQKGFYYSSRWFHDSVYGILTLNSFENDCQFFSDSSICLNVPVDVYRGSQPIPTQLRLVINAAARSGTWDFRTTAKYDNLGQLIENDGNICAIKFDVGDFYLHLLNLNTGKIFWKHEIIRPESSFSQKENN